MTIIGTPGCANLCSTNPPSTNDTRSHDLSFCDHYRDRNFDHTIRCTKLPIAHRRSQRLQFADSVRKLSRSSTPSFPFPAAPHKSREFNFESHFEFARVSRSLLSQQSFQFTIGFRFSVGCPRLKGAPNHEVANCELKHWKFSRSKVPNFTVCTSRFSRS